MAIDSYTGVEVWHDDFIEVNSRADVKRVVQLYEDWVSKAEYIILNHRIYKGSSFIPHVSEYIAVKASKRGNDVYNKRLKARTDYIKDSLKGVKVSYKHKGRLFTKMVFVTLTHNTKLPITISDAWYNIGIEFNRYMSRLRYKFGRVSIMRCWEAFGNGFPHIHALILFQDYSFSVTRVHEKDRIKEYKDFKQWHSFVDVKAVLNFEAGYNYLMKYLTKVYSSTSKKAQITKAMTWLFSKRSFFVSGEFMRALLDLNTKENTNKHCSKLDEDLIEVWAYVGSLDGSDMGLSKADRWLVYKDGAWHKMKYKQEIEIVAELVDEEERTEAVEWFNKVEWLDEDLLK